MTSGPGAGPEASLGKGQTELELYLLESFELRRSSGGVAPIPLGVQRLISFLALRERSLHRTHVAASLWPDTTEDKARANLRSAVWRLAATGVDVLDITTTHMRLGDDVWVDVRDGTVQARRLIDPTCECGEEDLQDLVLGGELLTDWYDDWVLIERERLRQLRLHALEALCKRLADAGRYAEAVDAGLQAVACEPLRESAQAVLIDAHIAEGNTVEALRQYQSYQSLLWDELGVGPGPGLETVVAALRPT
ncbi:MAG TPA: BTAD domain-containing putative transcriptional regulator [Acidimicrobiales bacterium]|nr:BTAD domain-containing putative transcriptional regulator [Acidimicrobiales bacterium]